MSFELVWLQYTTWCWRQEWFCMVSREITKIYSVLLIVRLKFILHEIYHHLLASFQYSYLGFTFHSKLLYRYVLFIKYLLCVCVCDFIFLQITYQFKFLHSYAWETQVTKRIWTIKLDIPNMNHRIRSVGFFN